jgi:cystathionine beta-lyase family protein involved in aluminum resistance
MAANLHLCGAPPGNGHVFRHAQILPSISSLTSLKTAFISRHIVAYGEGRSANRTKWATSNEDVAVLNPAAPASSSSTVPDNASISSQQSPSELVWGAAEAARPQFNAIDALVHSNISRVQKAFQAARVGPHHFAGSTGYGHGDLGREALDQVMAGIMGAESAAVRIQYMSGTHAIASALYGCLRPGDELLAVAGSPYDTLEEVVGMRGTPGAGSLIEFGVSYRKLELAPSGAIDWDALATAIKPETKVALVQRSCGYALRPTLSIDDIARCVQIIKKQRPDVLVLVDNCYGEFTDTLEPPAVGADLCMGSLIKNPGGTIVSGGGYVAGKTELVERALARLSAPGVGSDAGCVPGETLRLMFQGLFLAPQMVGEALKGGRLAAEVLSREGYTVIPAPGACQPWSFITAVELGSPERMQAFCRAVQASCPVGSYVRPIPGVTPGYGDEVIFADGTFIDGSTAELSADGPLREPYVVYCQGGTHWTHWALVLESAIEAMRLES